MPARPARESREDILHVPNLYEFFCQLTADDMRRRSGNDAPPAMSFAGLLVSLMLAVGLFVFGKPQLAKAVFVVFGCVLFWTVWNAVVRAGEQTRQKADSIMTGVFPPESAPYVIARLKWWNHLVASRRWGKHSRLYDRRMKLERKIKDLEARVVAVLPTANPGTPYSPPDDAEIAAVDERIQDYAGRSAVEEEIAAQPSELSRIRGELVLYNALLRKVNEMTNRLARIDDLPVSFQQISAADLSSLVSESIQVLEERRQLVLDVDAVDPDEFLDLVAVGIG